MAPSKIRKALGSMKDQTSISLAKVGSSNSLADLDVAIVKATRHEECPADERHIQEILSLTSYSHMYVSACINTLSRRLNKTKNWTVALKTLILIQRLLSGGDPSYEQEIFFATRRGTRFLNMSDFHDASKSNSWDYSAFVRTYALYLDERLVLKMQGRRGKRSAFGMEEENEEPGAARNKATPVREMKTEKIFSRIQHLQQLLDRFLACRPTGEAKHNRVVIVALYPIVKESFQLYYDITEILGIMIDRFMELDISGSIKVHEHFLRVSKQFEELDNFYAWSKSTGIARLSEYPEIDKITQKKLELIDDVIRDKSALAQTKGIDSAEPKNELVEEAKEPEVIEEDMNSIKALPPPEGFVETPVEEVKEEPKEEVKKEDNMLQEADLLNLGDDAVSTEEHANKLALALFDGGAPAGPPGPPAWEAFNEGGDWETALVQSASHLSHQQAALPGGFDMMLLDGMYQQGAIRASLSATGYGVSGSASSVALGSAGRPAMLALPAPPTSDGSGATTSADPFATSVAIAPPAYVQMSDMEKKQRLLVEEQLQWQQYARDRRQGHVGLSNQQPNNYNKGGYTRGY